MYEHPARKTRRTPYNRENNQTRQCKVIPLHPSTEECRSNIDLCLQDLLLDLDWLTR